MKSKWPGRLNIGRNTHSMVYQKGPVHHTGAKLFFFLDQSEKKTDLEKIRGTSFANYKMDTLCRQAFGVLPGAKKTTRGSQVEFIVNCTKFLQSKVQRQLLYYMEMGF